MVALFRLVCCGVYHDLNMVLIRTFVVARQAEAVVESILRERYRGWAGHARWSRFRHSRRSRFRGVALSRSRRCLRHLCLKGKCQQRNRRHLRRLCFTRKCQRRSRRFDLNWQHQHPWDDPGSFERGIITFKIIWKNTSSETVQKVTLTLLHSKINMK